MGQKDQNRCRFAYLNQESNRIFLKALSFEDIINKYDTGNNIQKSFLTCVWIILLIMALDNKTIQSRRWFAIMLVIMLTSSIFFLPYSISNTFAQPNVILQQTCRFDGTPIGTFTITGFPAGNTVLTRSDLQPGQHITTFLLSNNGSIVFEFQLITGTYTYTVFSDPNRNSIQDQGEVSAQATATTINCTRQPLNFASPINLSNNPGDSRSPKIATEGNNVNVVWFDSTSGNFEIFFSRSTDGGRTFSTPIILSNNAGMSSFPQIATNGNNVYVVWIDNTSGNFEIFFSRSTDGGNTFSSPVNLSSNNGFSIGPKMAIINNNIYVTWQEGASVFFTKSKDTGNTFDPPMDLSNGGLLQVSPDISAAGNTVYITAMGRSGSNIFFTKSTDGGNTFSSPINLSNNVGTPSLDFPRIAAYNDNVYVVWRDNTAISLGNNEILFARSVDRGNTFDPSLNLSNNPIGADPAEIVAMDSNVYIIWRDKIGPSSIPEIMFARSTDNGASFTKINLSNTPTGGSLIPDIAIFGPTNVSAVWEDNQIVPQNHYPFFTTSGNGGTTFSKPLALSTFAGEAREPQISQTKDKVHIVWSQNERDVYYVTNNVPNNPPTCATSFATPDVLWPPNRQMQKINIAGVADMDGDPVTIRITSIYQDEPTRLNPGDPKPDGTGIGSNSAQIRSERDGNGDGRVYHIEFIADDGKGGICNGDVLVSVPHDQAHSAIDSGANYDSTQ
ncbi:MAG: glycoside hydrolase [Thermoproteota archaeon]|nr:glycoside hydrolase [Thermoproteota archaeon]